MKNLTKVAIPLGIVAVVLMLVVPLPPVLLDVLLTLNIALAVLILLVAMNIKRPLDFAVFPTVVLVATLIRLTLNVASTRLVLSEGYAGKVIEALGTFAISGSLVIGLVLFTILMIFQFVVFTSGAGRAAEVGARFALDSLPGKQMAIDNDVAQGFITEEDARQRRKEVSAEADFYGSMDGASKFVKGDAIASVIVTLVNLIGGFAIGMFQNGMTAGDAINTYSLLSVGDGLVSLIPALLISVATGVVVTRTDSEKEMGSEIIHQMGRNQSPLWMAAGLMFVFILVPGLPKAPFFIVGCLLAVAAYALKNVQGKEDLAEKASEGADGKQDVAENSPEDITRKMLLDPLKLEVSLDLLDVVDPSRGGELMSRISALRKDIAMQTGLVIPMVHTRENVMLASGVYTIHLNGTKVGEGSAPSGSVLVIGDNLDALPGIPTREPVYGLDAKWVPLEMQRQAERMNLTVTDRSSLITTHIAEVVSQQGSQLLGQEDVKVFVEMVRKSHPNVVEALTPALLSLSQIQQVLVALLDEGVSIRDLVRIFEALVAAAPKSTETYALVAAVRKQLGSAIGAACVGYDGTLVAMTLNAKFENDLQGALRAGEDGPVLSPPPETAERLVTDTIELKTKADQLRVDPVVVCSNILRPALSRFLRDVNVSIPVLSFDEAPKGVQVDILGVIGDVHATV